MSTPTYIVGTAISLQGVFQDVDGTPVDPTGVTGKVRLPDGTTQNLTVTKKAIGIYTAPFTPTLNGLHEYRFAGTGTFVAAGESNFLAQTVFPS